MGAMVLHVAHRFKHAIFVSVRALLFHCSNFKKLHFVDSYRTFPYPGICCHYTINFIPAVSNSLFALISELACATAQNNGFVLTTQHNYYITDFRKCQVKILLNLYLLLLLHSSHRKIHIFHNPQGLNQILLFHKQGHLLNVIPFAFSHFL